MMSPNNLLVLAMGVCLAVVIAVILLRKKSPAYLPLDIMTPNELEFFQRMRRALGSQYYIFPQVAMAALIRPAQSYRQHKEAYWNIQKKRIDYAIYDSAMALICLVELDDKSHHRQRDNERDSWTQSAGITTLRWESKAKPSEKQIRAMILGAN